MKITALIGACIMVSCLQSAEVLNVWPDGKVPLQTSTKPEREQDHRGGTIRLTDVNVPTLTVFRAPDAKRAPAVIVCPGGGYSILAWNLEGTEIAEWLNTLGVTACVLKYRVPGNRNGAFCDAQRAVSLVRSRASVLGIDPAKIGIMGFSAGANLSARVSSDHKRRFYEPIDDVDHVSCRPDFSLIVYPWTLVKGDNREKILPLTLRDDFPVDATTPPAFLVQAMDDNCHVENTLAYCAALKYAGVKAEAHVFPNGGHGYGIRKHNKATDGWEKLAADWLSRTLKLKK